jgi:hypothetical protein
MKIGFGRFLSEKSYRLISRYPKRERKHSYRICQSTFNLALDRNPKSLLHLYMAAQMQFLEWPYWSAVKENVSGTYEHNHVCMYSTSWQFTSAEIDRLMLSKLPFQSGRWSVSRKMELSMVVFGQIKYGPYFRAMNKENSLDDSCNNSLSMAVC